MEEQLHQSFIYEKEDKETKNKNNIYYGSYEVNEKKIFVISEDKEEKEIFTQLAVDQVIYNFIEITEKEENAQISIELAEKLLNIGNTIVIKEKIRRNITTEDQLSLVIVLISYDHVIIGNIGNSKACIIREHEIFSEIPINSIKEFYLTKYDIIYFQTHISDEILNNEKVVWFLSEAEDIEMKKEALTQYLDEQKIEENYIVSFIQMLYEKPIIEEEPKIKKDISYIKYLLISVLFFCLLFFIGRFCLLQYKKSKITQYEENIKTHILEEEYEEARQELLLLKKLHQEIKSSNEKIQSIDNKIDEINKINQK